MAKKKRYYQSVGSRMDESRGMERELRRKGMEDAFYAGMDSRRRQEARDGGMLHEDKNAIANMPQHVIYREYPKPDYSGYPYLNDTISGIDRQMEMDNRKKQKHLQPEKY